MRLGTQLCSVPVCFGSYGTRRSGHSPQVSEKCQKALPPTQFSQESTQAKKTGRKKHKQRQLPQDKRHIVLKKTSPPPTDCPVTDTKGVEQQTLVSRNVILQPPQDTRRMVQPSNDWRVVVSILLNGFINLRNSCYISFILQCIFNIMDTSLQCQVETEDASLLSFLNLSQEWLRPTENVLNTSAFKYHFTKKFNKFINSLP